MLSGRPPGVSEEPVDDSEAAALKSGGKPQFQAAELDAVVANAKEQSRGYAAEVLRSDLLSVGVYTLPVRGVDGQTPHDEDEVYYAVRGRAMFFVAGREHAGRPWTPA